MEEYCRLSYFEVFGIIETAVVVVLFEATTQAATSVWFFLLNLLRLLSRYCSQVENGHIKRLTDNDLKSVALEIMGVNVATTYITTPIEPRASLAIKLPFLVLIVKNMKKFFSFEVQVCWSVKI